MLYAQNKFLLLNRYRNIRTFLIIILVVFSSPLHSNTFDSLTTLSIEKIEFTGIVLTGITSALDISNTKLAYKLKIDSLSIPERHVLVNDIDIKCKEGAFTLFEIQCTDGRISFHNPLVSAKDAHIEFSRLNNGVIDVLVKNIEIANGLSSIKINTKNNNWQVIVDSKNISISALQEFFPSINDYSPNGQSDVNIIIDGKSDFVRSMNGKIGFKNISFTNKESTIVGEKIFTKLEFQSSHNESVWINNFFSNFYAGEIYLDPIFIDAAEGPKEIFGSFEWQQDANALKLSPITYLDHDSLHVNIKTTQDVAVKEPTHPIVIDIQYANFPGAYDKYLQPLLLETKYSDLIVSGSVKGSMNILDSDIEHLNLDIRRLTVEDRLDRFAFYELDGVIAWGPQYEKQSYDLGFNAAKLYNLPFGKSNFEYKYNDQDLVLTKPVAVPILDGEFRIESFVMKHPSSENRSINLDVSLKPTSMEDVSAVFGWPEMTGNLSGFAPNVVYKDGNIDVQGALLIRAFDGTTTIHNLQAKDLFSPIPKLSADIQIKNLDLEPLTYTFSFGEITGRLDGYVNDLQLLNWKPIQFDAWLGTPIDDSSRHRISQTAVDNLTKVGNGASNIFSKGFLSFLDSFGYDRIGIGCKLENSTCTMKGVAKIEEGFYIVKGKGIPRIDIIGYTSEVSWPVLTERLNRIVYAQSDN